MDDTVDDVEQVREDGLLVISASNGCYCGVQHTRNTHSLNEVGFLEVNRGKARRDPRGNELSKYFPRSTYGA